MLLDRLRASAPAVLCAAASSVLCLGSPRSAIAQSAAPAAAASSPSAELTPAERAKRDGDKVFHWIMIHGDKPRKPVAAKDEKTVAAVRVKPVPRAAQRSDESTSADATVVAAAPATPAAATVSEAASGPAASSPVEPGADPVVLPTAAAEGAPPTEAVGAVASAAVPEESIEPLKPVAQVEPKFPANLVRTLRSGQVQVKFTVMPDGSVAEPTVLVSSNARLNAAAVAAVTQWRFAPLRKAQQGVVDLGFNNAE